MLWLKKSSSTAGSGPDTKRYPVGYCVYFLVAAELRFNAIKMLVHSCFRRIKNPKSRCLASEKRFGTTDPINRHGAQNQFQLQSTTGAGARTEILGKLKEEQLKVGPIGARHRGRCKSSSNRRLARRVREWGRPNQITRINADTKKGHAVTPGARTGGVFCWPTSKRA
jgi:hypothetical protein